MIKIILFSLWALTVHAESFSLERISKRNFKGIVQELGAQSKHTSLSGAESFTENKRYELGFISGRTESKTLGKVAASSSDADSLDSLPAVSFLGAVKLSKSFVGEVNYLPEIGSQGFRVTTGSLGIKWLSGNNFNWPIDASVKLYAGFGKIDWQQSGVTVEQEQMTQGLETHFGKKFSIVYPYLSFGIVRTTGSLESDSPISLFETSFTRGKRAEETVTSFTHALGLSSEFLFMRFAAEIGEAFESQFLRVKISTVF